MLAFLEVLLAGSRLRLRLASLVLLGALAPSAVQATLQRPLRVCVSDSPFPPFTHPSHEAPGQRRLRQAVESRGLTLEFFPRAWRRCLRGVQQRLYDGVIGTAATAEYLAILAFPRQRSRVDQRRALGTTTMRLYRRVGSRADWDGQAFQALDGPLLYLSGRSALGRMIRETGAKALDYPRSSEQLALMMLKGRGSLAIDHEIDVERVSRMPEYRNQFEILPRPFTQTAIYFAVGLDAYREQPGLFEAIWWDIARASTPAHAPAGRQ